MLAKASPRSKRWPPRVGAGRRLLSPARRSPPRPSAFGPLVERQWVERASHCRGSGDAPPGRPLIALSSGGLASLGSDGLGQCCPPPFGQRVRPGPSRRAVKPPAGWCMCRTERLIGACGLSQSVRARGLARASMPLVSRSAPRGGRSPLEGSRPPRGCLAQFPRGRPVRGVLGARRLAPPALGSRSSGGASEPRKSRQQEAAVMILSAGLGAAIAHPPRFRVAGGG